MGLTRGSRRFELPGHVARSPRGAVDGAPGRAVPAKAARPKFVLKDALADRDARGAVSDEVLAQRVAVCPGADRCSYCYRADDGEDYCRRISCRCDWKVTPLRILLTLRLARCPLKVPRFDKV